MSFRKYGGLQFSSKNNIVSSNYNSINNLYVSNNIGQPNSFIQYQSNLGGNIIIDGNLEVIGTITEGSDYRLKYNIKDLSLSEYTINNLRPVYFQFLDSKKESIGFIAHELQNEIPFLVEGEKDGEKLQTVNYIALIGLLIKEVQELKKEIILVKNELNVFKNK